MKLSSFVASFSLASTALAASSCSDQQRYNDLPGFPASNSGCYPTTYYRTSDLGSTSPDNARSRCQQQCTADAQCASVVAQVNKAADSNNYSGTCFFYNTAGTPQGPRQCANTAYLLLGYKKDNTLGCYSFSSFAATKFCSSYLGVPIKTSTSTETPAPVTTTSTAHTTQTLTTTKTITVTSMISTTSTSTSTVSATSTVYATVVRQSTVTKTSSSFYRSTIITTQTATLTITRTVTSTPGMAATQGGSGIGKRATARVPAPACVSSDTPATRLSAACSCLSVSTSTSITTTTLAPATSIAVTTSTATQTSTVSSTSVTTSISTATAQTVVTVTSATITSSHTITMDPTTVFTTLTFTLYPTVVTSTTIITTTTTTTVQPSPTVTNCLVQGGCPGTCSCARDTDGVNAYCVSSFAGIGNCSVDSDCTAGAICGGSGVCFATAGCHPTSTSTSTSTSTTTTSTTTPAATCQQSQCNPDGTGPCTCIADIDGVNNYCLFNAQYPTRNGGYVCYHDSDCVQGYRCSTGGQCYEPCP